MIYDLVSYIRTERDVDIVIHVMSRLTMYAIVRSPIYIGKCTMCCEFNCVPML